MNRPTPPAPDAPWPDPGAETPRPPRRANVLGWLLAAGLLAAECHAAAPGRFTVEEGPDAVTVQYHGDPAWKAVVDRTHGGVVSDFRLPADGPNLVAVGDKDDGTINPMRGLFNLFYMSLIEKGQTI